MRLERKEIGSGEPTHRLAASLASKSYLTQDKRVNDETNLHNFSQIAARELDRDPASLSDHDTPEFAHHGAKLSPQL